MDSFPIEMDQPAITPQKNHALTSPIDFRFGSVTTPWAFAKRPETAYTNRSPHHGPLSAPNSPAAPPPLRECPPGFQDCLTSTKAKGRSDPW